jgi:uncharacterized protein (DUF305 family)
MRVRRESPSGAPFSGPIYHNPKELFSMKKLLAVLAALFAVTLVGACGNDNMDGMDHGKSTPPSTKEAADHNAADVTFAQEMIPHHAQAITMAKVAATNAADPKVKDLAKRIEDAQDPEIKTMSDWLKAWGEDVPASDMGGMDHGSMPGMMSSSEMAALEKAAGAEFDKMFLQMMIRHHEGAIPMAEALRELGSDSRALAVAGSIEAGQTAEIDAMRSIQNRLGCTG